ncbi:MAG: YggS family pyridoxal phosphate-dependent enzyme [Pseudomonadota bacterium]
MTTIAAALELVRQRIVAACIACGRDATTVRLLAVSKTFDDGAVREAVAAGQLCFGENYIQEGVAKVAALRAALPQAPLEWHCIGPVQSNKTRLVAENFDWVQSIDKLKTAQRLSEQRPEHLPPLQVCLQVNIDGGPNKCGVAPQEARDLAIAVAALPRLVLRGIMAIPEPAPGFDAALAVHEETRRLFDEINAAKGLPYALDTLSMGMTADLEAAIHAGSTMVRVGTAIFGGRQAA